MQVQIKNIANDFKAQMAALSTLFLCGIFHLAFGANYIDKGNPLQSLTLPSLLANSKGTQGVGGFCIMAGLFMMAAPLVIYLNLNKIKTNKMMSKVSWMVTVIALLFNFTAAVLAAQIYTPIARYLASEGLSVSDLISYYKSMLNFALADSIIAFILGFPASIILLFSANYHRTRVGIDNESPGPEVKDNEEATGRFGRNSPPPNSVDLEKQIYHYETQRKMHKEENQAQEQQRPPTQIVQVQPAQNPYSPMIQQPAEVHRSPPSLNSRHSYVVYSSPNFQVESEQPRRSSLPKALGHLPQATTPKTFIS